MDCFTAALQVSPEDACCVCLCYLIYSSQHREAVEHLTALHLQNHADIPAGMKNEMSEGIWSTLIKTCHFVFG